MLLSDSSSEESSDSSSEFPNLGNYTGKFKYHDHSKAATSNTAKILDNQAFVFPHYLPNPPAEQKSNTSSSIPMGVPLKFPVNFPGQPSANINPFSKTEDHPASNPSIEVIPDSTEEPFSEKYPKGNKNQLPISKPIPSIPAPAKINHPIPPPFSIPVTQENLSNPPIQKPPASVTPVLKNILQADLNKNNANDEDLVTFGPPHKTNPPSTTPNIQLLNFNNNPNPLKIPAPKNTNPNCKHESLKITPLSSQSKPISSALPPILTPSQPIHFTQPPTLPQSQPIFSIPPPLLTQPLSGQISSTEQLKPKLAPPPLLSVSSTQQNPLAFSEILPTQQPPPLYKGTLPFQPQPIQEPIAKIPLSHNNPEAKPQLNLIVTSPLEEEKNLDFCSNQTISDDNTSVNARDKDLESVNQVIIDVQKCCHCGENKNEEVLKCGHILCKECIQDSVENAVPKQIYYSRNSKIHPKCLSCSKDIDEIFFVNENYYKKLKNDHIDRYMQLISGAKKCLGCKNYYPLKGFFDEDICKHLCKDCLSIEIVLSKEKCSYCLCKYDLDKIKNYKEKCSCCLKEKIYIEDYVFSLCKGHSHCFDCAKQAVKEKSCCKCKESIGQKDLIRTLKRLKNIKG